MARHILHSPLLALLHQECIYSLTALTHLHSERTKVAVDKKPNKNSPLNIFWTLTLLTSYFQKCEGSRRYPQESVVWIYDTFENNLGHSNLITFGKKILSDSKKKEKKVIFGVLRTKVVLKFSVRLQKKKKKCKF